MATTSLAVTAKHIVSTKRAGLIPDAVIKEIPSGERLPFVPESLPLQLTELHETLLVLEASFRQSPLDNDEITTTVWNWTFDAIQLTRVFSNGSLPIEDAETWALVANVALHLLTNIVSDHPLSVADNSVKHIATLIFWHMSEHPRILSDCRTLANHLLKRAILEYDKHLKHKLSIQSALLQNIVRPAFARLRPSNITVAGRKTIYTSSQALTASEDDKVLKPWKFDQQFVVDILAWTLHNSNARIIEDNWHFITPPLLTILDDEDMDNKAKGCRHLQQLFKSAPSNIWALTGLAKVFEDALMPALAYLPPLTDESDAEKLLEVLYPTLIALCELQYAVPEQQVKRARFLDEMLRSGILTGLGFCGDNVRMAGILLGKIPVVLSEMGIQCVKHLKALVPLLVAYLSDPFAFASPALLQSAITALQSVILNGWPRIEQYCGELFSGISICWHRLGEEKESDTLAMAKRDLQKTMKLLLRAIEDAGTVQQIEAIVAAEASIHGLLAN